MGSFGKKGWPRHLGLARASDLPAGGVFGPRAGLARRAVRGVAKATLADGIGLGPLTTVHGKHAWHFRNAIYRLPDEGRQPFIRAEAGW